MVWVEQVERQSCEIIGDTVGEKGKIKRG